MVKDENFFEKHSGKISATGLAINALQNQKIANRQKAVAKLQAKTAQLQYEENELKKKELELLKKEQKALEEERKRKRKLEKQQKELKAELLDITPKISALLDKISKGNKEDPFQLGKDLYEVNCVLAYINSNKDVIEDINFHNHLFKLNNQLAHHNKQFQRSYNLFDQYLETFQDTIDEYDNLFNGIQILVNGFSREENYQLGEIQNFEETIESRHHQKELYQHLLDDLKEYKRLIFNENNYISEDLISLPLSKGHCDLIIDFLDQLDQKRIFEEEIKNRLKIIYANISASKTLKNIKNKSNYDLKLLSNNIKKINLDLVQNDIRNELKRMVSNLKRKVDKNIRKAKREISQKDNNKTGKENLVRAYPQIKRVTITANLKIKEDLKKQYKELYHSYSSKNTFSVVTMFSGFALFILMFFMDTAGAGAILFIMGGIIMWIGVGLNNYYSNWLNEQTEQLLEPYFNSIYSHLDNIEDSLNS